MIILGIIFLFLSMKIILRPELLICLIKRLKNNGDGMTSDIYLKSTRFVGILWLIVSIYCIYAWLSI